MSMQPARSLVLTWVERGKWTATVSLSPKNHEYELSMAADSAVGASGVFRRPGLIMNSVRFHLLDAEGYPIPWPSERGMRIPKL